VKRKKIKFIFFKISRTVKVKLLSIKRIFFKPSLPVSKEKLIHLGCGDINSPEFINIDARPLPHVHYVSNIDDLSFLGNDYADLVYACCLLEHIPYQKAKNVIWEWRRVLKKGGILRLSVPDFDKIVEIYNENSRDIGIILPPLMGGQGYKNNFHYSAFNKEYLTTLLQEVGFKTIREWDPNKVEQHNFEDWASKKFKVKNKEYPISLNLEAVK